MQPVMENAVPGFLWSWNSMVVQEKTSWYNLAQWMPPDKPYFYERFLETKGKKGELVFKSPKSPVILVLVIDHDQHMRVEDFLDEQENKLECERVSHFDHLECDNGTKVIQRP
jgi:hypothetical protein